MTASSDLGMALTDVSLYADAYLDTDMSAIAWDAALAELGGHALQSSAWGEARQIENGIPSRYWCIKRADVPVWLARVETRDLPIMGRIAWIPRGPTAISSLDTDIVPALALAELRRRRFDIVVTDAWTPLPQTIPAPDRAGQLPRTIWLDLTLGQEQLWKNLHSQIRSRVRKARQAGVVIRSATTRSEVQRFVEICRDIEKTKNFDARISVDLVEGLLRLNADTADIQCALLLASHGERIGAGAFIIRVGRKMSMMWAASDREFAAERVGEAAHWAAVEWGLAHQCQLYDLEGIDAIKNPGVHRFKTHFGGREVAFPGKKYVPLSLLGRLVLPGVAHFVNRR